MTQEERTKKYIEVNRMPDAVRLEIRDRRIDALAVEKPCA